MRAPHRLAAYRRRGMSLLFALLALAVLSLAAMALVRSVDTSSLVIGNLGFKQDATSAASQAAEQAISWLQTNAGATLYTDKPASGYYAASMDALDPTGHGTTDDRAVVDWNSDSCASMNAASYARCVTASAEITLNNGANTARYIITRLCASEGNPSETNPGPLNPRPTCAFPLGSVTASGGYKGALDYKPARVTAQVSNQQYYRIVVRATGGRGTVSYTETIVQM